MKPLAQVIQLVKGQIGLVHTIDSLIRQKKKHIRWNREPKRNKDGQDREPWDRLVIRNDESEKSKQKW